jgi:hypothetical protein
MTLAILAVMRHSTGNKRWIATSASACHRSPIWRNTLSERLPSLNTLCCASLPWIPCMTSSWTGFVYKYRPIGIVQQRTSTGLCGDASAIVAVLTVPGVARSRYLQISPDFLRSVRLFVSYRAETLGDAQAV